MFQGLFASTHTDAKGIQMANFCACVDLEDAQTLTCVFVCSLFNEAFQ
jgi:hypothetical protein